MRTNLQLLEDRLSLVEDQLLETVSRTTTDLSLEYIKAGYSSRAERVLAYGSRLAELIRAERSDRKMQECPE